MEMLSKSQQVEKVLRESIKQGRWAIGERIPSEDELVEEFRISRRTLRDALLTLAHDGLIVRKHGSGTYVSDIPSAGSVALVALAKGLTSPQGYFHRALLEEASGRIQNTKYKALLSVGHGDTAEALMSSMPLFHSSFKNEVVGVLGELDVTEIIERMHKEHIPHVLIGYGTPIGRYSVVLDYAKMVEKALLMLNAYGHSDFSLMYISHMQQAGEDIENNHHKTLLNMCRKAVGYDENRLIPVPWSPNFEHVRDAFRNWWAGPNRSSAIYFFDDALCDVAVRDILDLGIRVPEDLAILTNTNMDKDFHFSTPITGLEFSPIETATAAWDLLNRVIKGYPIDDPVVYIPPKMRKGLSLGESAIYGK